MTVFHFLDNELPLTLGHQESHDEEASDDQDRAHNHDQDHDDEVVVIAVVKLAGGQLVLDVHVDVSVDRHVVLDDRDVFLAILIVISTIIRS